MDVAKLLIDKLTDDKILENHIEFVEDRPFNDFRYSVDTTLLKSLGWEELFVNFNANIDHASRVILSQKAEAWVDLNNDFHVLPDGRFIWSNEDSGWRHLYLYNRDGGRIRAITSGDWPVKTLNGVNQRTGEVFFTASMRDGAELPIEQQMFRASLRRTVTPLAVTPGGGWWGASMNRTGTAYVGNYSDLNTPAQSALYRADGTFVRWIEENRLDADHPIYPYVSRRGAVTFGTLKRDPIKLSQQPTPTARKVTRACPSNRAMTGHRGRLVCALESESLRFNMYI
jgi:dipeptidyl aminopeptidase/acylaminoacyl peptidase